MRLADALVTALRDWELRYVFGVSGANIEHVHDSIHRLGNGRLRSVMTRREDGAAFMADARARVHRTLGVCCATSGGGMINLLAGLAESYAESVPVLALVGQPPTTLEGRGAFQDSSGVGATVDAEALLGSMTKRVAKITAPDTFWTELRASVTAALTGRQGPVVLLLPRDLYDQDVGERPADWPVAVQDLVDHPPVCAKQVRRLFEAIMDADQPVLLLGHGVRRGSDPDAVVRFARSIGIPVATTMSARGEFPNDDPLYLGVVGAAGHPSAHDVVKDSDLIVVVGAGLNAMTRAPLGELSGDRIALVNIDPGQATRVVAPRLVVCADAGAAFHALLELATTEPFIVPPLVDYRLRRYRPRLAPPIPGRPVPAEFLVQSKVISAIQPFLPDNGHIVLDAGNCASAAIHLSHVPPGTSSTIALGMGGMGYSLAAGIGVQLGSPDGTRTVVLCGDGAFLMNGFEVHTAVDQQVPVLFLVFNNNLHGMCATRQQTFFGSRLECVQYPPVDVSGVARALGSPELLWVGSAGTLDELHLCLEDYHSGHTHLPGVLELRLPVEEVPPFSSLLSADEPTYEPGRASGRGGIGHDRIMALDVSP